MATPEAVKISVPADSVMPTEAWDRRKVKQTVKVVKQLSHSQKKKDGHTRFVCISGIRYSFSITNVCFRSCFSFFSDTHSKTNDLKLPDGDVLLHTGDFSNVGKPIDIERFCEFLKQQPHAHKVHKM